MNYKPSFLNHARPLVTGMILKDNPNDVRYTVKNSIYAGADALGIQLCRIKREYRTEENFKAMFSACGGRPIYITNYRYCRNVGMTDEERVEELKFALKCGATLADMTADTFDETESEFTTNPAAVEKQMKVISEMHEMGKEVLLSSHIYTFTPAERVLEIALEHQRRGADIAKIVTGANSEEEMLENFKITTLLKKELDIPFLFLAGGTHSKIHRMISPQLGCFTYLAVYEHDSESVPTQPTIAAAKAVRDNIDFMPDLIF